MRLTTWLVTAWLLLAFLLPGASARAAIELSEDEARDLAVEAYLFFYPLVSMEVTRKVSTTATGEAGDANAPMNVFRHMPAFPTAEFRDVVRPNFDTLYSSAWLDLTGGPVIVSAEDTAGRYYLLPLMDMWSDVFAAPGARTTGTGAGRWAVVPQGWSGELPPGVERVDAPTPYVWLIGRTQTNGPQDYAAVHQVQAGFRVTPLAQWSGSPAAPSATPPAVDPTVDHKTAPLAQVNSMPGDRYFAYAADLMTLHPPHVTDWSQAARLRRLGIRAGEKFDFAAAPKVVQEALLAAPAEAQRRMMAGRGSLGRLVNGWLMNVETMGVYGNDYLKRAVIAMVGLGANQPEDAVYPLCVADADGQPLRGGERYVIRFEKDQLPPVDAFWSITMYDGDGFQVANALNRFAIGDRDPLKRGPDGSVEILLQPTSPGAELESNWLPSPAEGAIGVTMRLYAPRAEALDGRWAPPAVHRLK